MALIARFGWALGLAGGLAWLGALSGWYLAGTAAGPPTTLGILGTLLLLGWAAVDRQALAQTAGSRWFKLTAGSVSLQAAVLALGVLAYLVVDERFDRTYDLTRQGAHSLSSQTEAVLDGIDAPIEVIAFFEEGTSPALEFSRLIQLYTERSPNLRLEWVDLLENPVRAGREQVQGHTVILRQGDREERLEMDFGETNLTRRLVLVQAETTHTICWSVGHGEADPDDDVEPIGYGAAVLTLEGLNYQVLHTSLAGQGVDPACEVLVVARPRRDFLPWEREAIAAHVGAGRHAVFLLDPLVDTPELNAELDRYGVRVFDDIVFDDDPASMLAGQPGALALYGDSLLPHPINRGLAGAAVLPVARSLGDESRDGLLVEELLRTSQQGWGETDLQNEVVEPNEGLDRIGALPVALVTEVVEPRVLDVVLPEGGPTDPQAGLDGLDADVGRLVPADWEPAPGGRVVVFGDADFPTNTGLALGANQDLLLNTFAWLVGEEEQIGSRPELGEPLDLSAFASALICLTSIVFVPGAAFLFAMLAVFRRRGGAR